eukprot:COSAG05_NODE_120_length_17734_cov_79.637823_15_plen_123_part_00
MNPPANLTVTSLHSAETFVCTLWVLLLNWWVAGTVVHDDQASFKHFDKNKSGSLAAFEFTAALNAVRPLLVPTPSIGKPGFTPSAVVFHVFRVPSSTVELEFSFFFFCCCCCCCCCCLALGR